MRFRPHVVLAAEDISYLHLRGHLPKSIFVHTRHGLASKGIPEKSFRAADYVCVTSDYIERDFTSRGIKPRRAFWTIGYIQMDNLLRAQRPPQIPPGRKVVLYAPTWHHGLSSLPLLAQNAVKLLKQGAPESFLVIKPHPLVQQGVDPALAPWMEDLRAQCRGRDDVYLVEDRSSDIMPLLKAADVLVTDASSVQLEYLALDRPIVLINHPERFQSPHFDPSGYEWAWRDMGQTVDRLDQLPQAIHTALENPALGRTERARYREMLFGDNADGRAGRRLAERIASLESRVASEASLLAVSPLGHAFYNVLPHLRNISYALRRLRKA
jgi:CDP-glycerol glycerophosphotransferase (TagB/SpsB family)